MKIHVVSVLIGIQTLALMACSGQGNNFGLNLPGQQCVQDFDPIPVGTVPAAEKKSLRPEDQVLKPGRYNYDGADIYYIDKSDFRVFVSDVPLNNKGDFGPKINCVRNARAAVEGLQFSIDAVTDIDMGQNFKAFVNQRKFTVHVKDRLIDFKFESDKSSGKPWDGKVYDKSAGVTEAFLLAKQNDPNGFEIRTSGVSENGIVHTIIRLRYVPDHTTFENRR